MVHTSLLPSNRQLDKIFVLADELGQVHMANKKFPIFLHAGRGNGRGKDLEGFGRISNRYKDLSFL